MDAHALHLVFGSTGQAPAWVGQALTDNGSIDSRLVAGIWVHTPTGIDDAPGLQRIVRRGIDTAKNTGRAHRVLIPLAPLVPDHVPDNLHGGA